MQERPADAAREAADWARQAAGLPAYAPVEVVERAVARSGWPPFETAFCWETPHGRHERVVSKRLAALTRLDVLAAWRTGDGCCGP
jgi:hypothetical protein